MCFLRGASRQKKESSYVTRSHQRRRNWQSVTMKNVFLRPPPPLPSFRSTTVKETHSGCLSAPFVGHWEIHERLFWCQPEEQFIIREQIIHSVGMESLITLNRSEWQCWRYLGRIFSTHHQTLNPLTEKNMKLRSLLSFLQCFIYFLHKWDEKVRQIEPKCCSCWSTAHSYS